MTKYMGFLAAYDDPELANLRLEARAPGELFGRSEVELDRRHGRIEADVKVVVEVAVVRRVPREGPAALALVPLQFGQRSTRHNCERGVAGVEMGVVNTGGVKLEAQLPTR